MSLRAELADRLERELGTDELPGMWRLPAADVRIIIAALRGAPSEANDDDARDAARWRAIEWRWGSGTVTLDCDDKGFFRMQVEHAEANDEYITALDPEGVLAKAITAEEASSREYVQ